MRRIGRALLCVPLALGLCAASGYRLRPQVVVVRELVDPPRVGDEREVPEHGAIIRGKIAAAPVATLGEPVTVSVAGRQVALAKGAELRAYSLAGSAAGLPRDSDVYCAPTMQSGAELGAKAVLSAAAFGLFSGAPRTRAGSQPCLVDADRDGAADWAIQSGVQREADLSPVAIDHGPLAVDRDRPFADGGAVEIAFAGPLGAGQKRLSFGFGLAEPKTKTAAAHTTVLVKTAELPKAIEIGGARLTILAYDPMTRKIRVRIDSLLPMGPFALPVTPTTMFVPVYIAH